MSRPMQATIYARYSSAEQGRAGRDTLERQLRDCKKFATQNGWEWSEDRIIVDEGLSGFHAANRAEGAGLFRFEEQARAGRFADGHVFVVENVDRISRQGFLEVQEFIGALTRNGVTIATVDGAQIYRPNERQALGQLMTTAVKSELAWEESAKKSTRSVSAWAAKIKQAERQDGRAVTRLVPGWIVVDPVTRMMSLHEQRQQTVIDIFEWCASGHGAPAIVKMLNERGEETWGEYSKDDEAKGRVKGQKRGRGWHVGTILKLLANPAVLGEYQPMTRARSATLATVKGERIANYYPAAVDHGLWSRAQDARKKRIKSGGRLWSERINLLAGIALCASCGGRMDYVGTALKGQERKGSNGSRQPYTYVTKEAVSYLQCNAARRRHECDNRTRIRYQRLEPAVLDAVLHLALDNSHFEVADNVSAISTDIARIEREQDERGERLGRLVDAFSRTGSAAIEGGIVSLESEIARAATALSALTERLDEARGRVSPEEHRRRIGEVRKLIEDEDDAVRLDARRRLHSALGALITIHCSPQRDSTVMVAGGLIQVQIGQSGEILEVVDHTLENPVTIKRQRDYAAEEQRRAAGGKEFTQRGRFIPIYQDANITVQPSDALIKGFKSDRPQLADQVDAVVRRRGKNKAQ